MSSVGDWSGDGADDIPVDCLNGGVGGPTEHTLHVIDGAALVYPSQGTEIQEHSLGSWVWSDDEGWLLIYEISATEDLDGDGLPDISVNHKTEPANPDAYQDNTIHLIPSSWGIPGPYADGTESGLAITSDRGIHSGETFMTQSSSGDLDADGRTDLAFYLWTQDEHELGRTEIENHYLLGWDLPWGDPQAW